MKTYVVYSSAEESWLTFFMSKKVTKKDIIQAPWRLPEKPILGWIFSHKPSFWPFNLQFTPFPKNPSRPAIGRKIEMWFTHFQCICITAWLWAVASRRVHIQYQIIVVSFFIFLSILQVNLRRYFQFSKFYTQRFVHFLSV